MPKIDLNKAKKVYFIGIGGIGMSAVARMFLLEGKEVNGSDLAASEVTSELEKIGAKIRIGEPANVLPTGTDLVIYTVAIPDTHPELVSAKKLGVPTISYPESLTLISKDKFTIAIAGTHGKTTTTAMIAKILIEAGLDPTVIVGSFLKDQKSNFVAGKGKYFIVEACEYKRSFLNLHPDIAVVLNIDDDHLDYYKDLSGIQKGFREFVEQVKPNGKVVTDTENVNIRPVIADLGAEVIDYQEIKERVRLKIPGEHNIQNAKAALAVAIALGVEKGKAVSALEKFSGTWRRFDEKGKTANGALVYDDYGHHPTEIAATLRGAREKFPNQKIIVAFQPHLYSRTKEHFDEFGGALSLADEIILLPIYAAREPKDPTVSSELLAKNIKKSGFKADFFENFEAASEYLKSHLKSGDIFLTMGAGDINKLGEIVLGVI